MALSISVTAAKIGITSTDVGGNTFEEIEAAIADISVLEIIGGVVTIKKPMGGEFRELEISSNCWVKMET